MNLSAGSESLQLFSLPLPGVPNNCHTTQMLLFELCSDPSLDGSLWPKEQDTRHELQRTRFQSSQQHFWMVLIPCMAFTLHFRIVT